MDGENKKRMAFFPDHGFIPKTTASMLKEQRIYEFERDYVSSLIRIQIFSYLITASVDYFLGFYLITVSGFETCTPYLPFIRRSIFSL